jgi:SAM-dependent methyltransferase
MTDTVERFSNRVENYVKYRPDYPSDIVAYLSDAIGLTPAMLIADIGCGTGFSSRLFLENGNSVVGVEPNDAMRNAAIQYLADHSKFRLVNGTAENTTLEDHSMDVVLAGQAFHWFDLEKTKPEFKRILKPGGHVVLMWNERQLDTTPFLVEYEQLLVKYSTDYAVVRHDRFDEEVLSTFFDSGVKKAVFANVQNVDFNGLKGRMLSASYMPSEQDVVFPTMIDELQTLFAKHSENDRINILYDTNVYVSEG